MSAEITGPMMPTGVEQWFARNGMLGSYFLLEPEETSQNPSEPPWSPVVESSNRKKHSRDLRERASSPRENSSSRKTRFVETSPDFRNKNEKTTHVQILEIRLLSRLWKPDEKNDSCPA